MAMLFRSAILLIGLFCFSQTATAATIDESFCNKPGLAAAKRQTLLVVDGQVIHPESDGQRNPENREWREYVAKLVNGDDPAIGQRFAPRERFMIAIAEADGSGITPLFSGCLPIYSKEEQDKLEAGGGAVGEFFGRGWKADLKTAREKFRRSLVLALVEGTVSAKSGDLQPNTKLADSALVSSLLRGLPIALENGIPRLVVYSDLAKLSLPEGEVSDVRRAGRADAERIGLNLQYSEVHVIGVTGRKGSADSEYLNAFILAGKGEVAALAGRNAGIKTVNPPERVAVYQGKITYPDGTYPIRMRLALDRNGTAVNSWIEEVSDRARFTPFGGVLTCATGDKCNFVGDRIFAQVWSDNPNPNPEFASWMPFAGFRELVFSLSGATIVGTIKDSAGYVPGMENGIKFEVQRVENGLF